MAFYNHHYNYPDQFLWDPKTWEGYENQAAPLYHKIEELIKADEADHFTGDRFADRHDEHADSINRSFYFDDVVEEWKKKGMYFLSSGMMDALMAPEAVEKHEIYEARVLYVPYAKQFGDRHQIMNLVEDNRELLEFASRENILVQFADCKACAGSAQMEKAMETQGTFRISYQPVLLDISVLYQHGLTLADVKGLDSGSWKEPFLLGGRMVVDISDKWQMNMAHQFIISQLYHKFVPEWDSDRHIRTQGGKRQAEGMRLEYQLSGPNDPWMAGFWKEKGIRQENHYLGHDWYVTLTPESSFDYKDDTVQNVAGLHSGTGVHSENSGQEKIPLLVVMKEVRTSCPVTMQTAFQFYYDFIELCARGQFMMLFFALETPWDNDEVLPGIIEEVLQQYPADRTRIYLTGQSHNGYYALEFYRRHPKLIAAAATLNDPAGLEAGARVDYYKTKATEIIESFRQYDYPLIDINGNLENNYAKTNRTPEQTEDDIFYFQNRMKAWKHREYTREEILAAQNSPDPATRRNGIPADRTEVRFTMGIEAYLSDYRDENGKWYYRYISLENVPHMIMPQMADLAWEYLRRFSRDPSTGETLGTGSNVLRSVPIVL